MQATDWKRTARRMMTAWAIGAGLILFLATFGKADSGRIRVLVAADEDPEMFSFQPGTPPGLEREMIEGFARQQGRTVDVIPVGNFEQIIPMLNSGQGDVILGIVDTEGRRAQVAFTEEVLPTRHVVVNLSNRPPIRTAEQLRHEKVGILPGTRWADAANEAGVSSARSTMFNDTRPMLEALRRGEITATVMGIASFALARKRHPELQAGLFLGPLGHHCWAVRKDDTALQGQLNRHITVLKGSGSWSPLLTRYLSSDVLTLFKNARQS